MLKKSIAKRLLLNHYVLGILCWLVGAALAQFSIIKASCATRLSTHSASVMGFYGKESSSVFITILKANLSAGLIISVGGLLSAGMLTTVVFIWNGFILSFVICAALGSGMPVSEICYYLLLHSCIELFAFLQLGSIGFSGFYFFRKILKSGVVDFKELPQPKQFILPIALLIIAAFIESIL